MEASTMSKLATVLCFVVLFHDCVSRLENSDGENSIPVECYEYIDLPDDDVNRQGDYSREPRQAVEETTPAECSPGINCGFQRYELIGLDKKDDGKFIHYCTCPEGTKCTKVGENMKMKFYYYKCLPTVSSTALLSTDYGVTTETTEAKTTENDATPSSTETSTNATPFTEVQDRLGYVTVHAEL